jgi:acyl carrier protein
MNEISQQVQLILIRILKSENHSVTGDSSPLNLEGWDSLVQVELIAAVEEQFNITFSLKDLPKLNSIRSISELVEHKLHS